MPAAIDIQTTITYGHIQNANSRVTQHIGGTRSGKTYAILQWLLVQMISNEGLNITVVRKTIPSLKRTVIKDWIDILKGLDIWKEDDYNATDTVSPYHWLRQMSDCQRFVTTYKDNTFLPKEMVKAIEDLQTKNEKYWKIYGLGEFAPNEKAVYGFDIVDDFEAEFVAFGLDWGYSQDPTAVVEVYKNGDNLYLEEVLYEKGLVLKDIADALSKKEIDKSYEIWCDSSEPRSIEELYRYGFNAKAVTKGKDSIKFGISVLQNHKIHVLRSSQNLINELYGYQYATDKYGYVTDTPEGGLDHLLDAARYVGMMRLTQKATKKGTYAITIR